MQAIAHAGDVLAVQERLGAREKDVCGSAMGVAEVPGDFEDVAAVHVGVLARGGVGAGEGGEDWGGEGRGDGVGGCGHGGLESVGGRGWGGGYVCGGCGRL